ncbi:MAG TPA: DUF305 domain-containing protein [Acidimicrobiia bacterium]|nr:DUF305 domain-containing protein [Acidimicrobiia bacterium]
MTVDGIVETPVADEPVTRTGPPLPVLVVFVAALCFVAGVIGWRIGRPGDPPADAVSVGFLDDMTYHHEQALVLSFAYLEGAPTDWFLRHTAEEIVRVQSYEIGVMQERLRENGGTGSPDIAMDWMGMPSAPAEMPGLATDAEIVALRGARGAEADELFSRLMILHHAGGIHMADDANERADDGFVRELAARMAGLQRTEVAEMSADRVEQGFAPVDTDAIAHHG